MTERLTKGTTVVGEMDNMGFWPVDFGRIFKTIKSAQEIESSMRSKRESKTRLSRARDRDNRTLLPLPHPSDAVKVRFIWLIPITSHQRW
jgi:hypothetical protein